MNRFLYNTFITAVLLSCVGCAYSYNAVIFEPETDTFLTRKTYGLEDRFYYIADDFILDIRAIININDNPCTDPKDRTKLIVDCSELIIDSEKHYLSIFTSLYSSKEINNDFAKIHAVMCANNIKHEPLKPGERLHFSVINRVSGSTGYSVARQEPDIYKITKGVQLFGKKYHYIYRDNFVYKLHRSDNNMEEFDIVFPDAIDGKTIPPIKFKVKYVVKSGILLFPGP